MDTKDDIYETTKFISLQFLCGVIIHHVQGGKEFRRCFLICDTISDEIIPDIDVANTLDN